MARALAITRGMLPAWSGPSHLRRPRTTSTRRQSSQPNLTTTAICRRISRSHGRKPLSAGSHAHDLIARRTIDVHSLHGHFAELPQQREAASLGMWVFLVTEVMFFGGMITGYVAY